MRSKFRSLGAVILTFTMVILVVLIYTTKASKVENKGVSPPIYVIPSERESKQISIIKIGAAREATATTAIFRGESFGDRLERRNWGNVTERNGFIRTDYYPRE